MLPLAHNNIRYVLCLHPKRIFSIFNLDAVLFFQLLLLLLLLCIRICSFQYNHFIHSTAQFEVIPSCSAILFNLQPLRFGKPDLSLKYTAFGIKHTTNCEPIERVESLYTFSKYLRMHVYVVVFVQIGYQNDRFAKIIEKNTHTHTNSS